MAYTGNDFSGYNARAGYLGRREDGDGKAHIYARTLTSATFGVPKVLYFNASNCVAGGGIGYYATAPFGTDKGSGAAAACSGYFIGIPNETVPSFSDGWFQISGVFKNAALISCSGAGNSFAVKWSSATIAVGATYSVSDPNIDTFAVMLSSFTNTNAAHDIYMFGLPVCGTTA
jgi:hypothetical protein